MDITEQLWILKQIYSQRSLYDSNLGSSIYQIPSSISKKDLEELKKENHFPNNFVQQEHDKIIVNLKKFSKQWTIKEASDAFIASLWSAPIIWRSLLTGKLIADSIQEHNYTPYSSSNTCRICGIKENSNIDRSLEWYFLMTNGTSLDGDLFGHLVAMEELSNEKILPKPNDYDLWVFRKMLTVIRLLPDKARYSKAAEFLKKENLLPSKKLYLYKNLLESLAIIGILDTNDYPGMATSYTTYEKRDMRPNTKVEVQAPLAWWDSNIGINENTLKTIFSNYDLSNVSSIHIPKEIPPKKETVLGCLESKRVTRSNIPKTPPDAGKGPARFGDVYAVRIREGLWVTLYCHDISKDNRVKVEFLEGTFEDIPLKSDLKLYFRPRKDGRWQCLVSSLDSTSWIRRVARNITRPETIIAPPDRVFMDNARNLKYLADWCFPEIN